MTAVIDIESFIYKACTICEDVVEVALGSGIYQMQWDLQRVKEYFDNLLTDVTGTTDQDNYTFVFGDWKNYRKVINPEYKANRKDAVKHPMLKVIKDYVLNNYNCEMYGWVEADDTCRILYEQDPFNNVIVSIDKDLKTLNTFREH